MRLRDLEFIALRKKFIEYLNRYESDPELKLKEDYFYDYELHMSETWYGAYRYICLTLLTMDDGGPTMLYLHTDRDDLLAIEFASWTFDTTTSVWIKDHEAVDSIS